jgi:hypothetical protein
MENKDLEKRLMAKIETSNVILIGSLPVARVVIHNIVPIFMGILRQELNAQRREFEAKEQRRKAGG